MYDLDFLILGRIGAGKNKDNKKARKVQSLRRNETNEKHLMIKERAEKKKVNMNF